MIYLDNAATTKLSPGVFAAMAPYLQEEYGNAGSIYSLGRRAAEAITAARKQVADLIGAKPEQIIFTSGGTEANNLAILGTKHYLGKVCKKHIITSSVEHSSVLNAVKSLHCDNEECIKDEFYISYLPVNKDGVVSIENFIGSLQDNTGLVSVMCVNNELGTRNPVIQLGDICRQKNILFHTDCVQAAGSYTLDNISKHCDFLSISSHKIHGPKGVGALYVRNAEYLSPIINGGSEQEFGLRGGTENVAGIVGFGKACELAMEDLSENIRITTNYKQCFYNVLRKKLYDNNLYNVMKLNGLPPECPGRILSLTFNGVDAETLVLMMDAKEICISAGSACHSHESKPSHVLTALGLSEEEARSTVRISFSEFNEMCEVEKAAKLLADCVQVLGGMN